MNYLGIDVGGSSIKHAVMAEGYQILSQGTLDGRAEDREAFLDAICVLYEHAGRPEGGIAISYAVNHPDLGEHFARLFGE